MTVGQKMKGRRKELGLTAEYVANGLGVSAATIYRYEKGDIEKLPGNILNPLANILCTTPAFLMGWTDVPTDDISTDKHKSEIIKIMDELSPDNRAKLLELARLYLDAERKSK